jgi:hypothetical protein
MHMRAVATALRACDLELHNAITSLYEHLHSACERADAYTLQVLHLLEHVRYDSNFLS